METADAYVEAQRSAHGSQPAKIPHRVDTTDERDGFRLLCAGVKIQLIETRIHKPEHGERRRKITWRMYIPNLFTAAALLCRAVRWDSKRAKPEDYTADFIPPPVKDIERRLDRGTGVLEVWCYLAGDPIELAARRMLMHNGEFWIPMTERPSYTRHHVELTQRCDEAMKEARTRLQSINSGGLQ